MQSSSVSLPGQASWSFSRAGTIAALGITLLASGCAITPKPLSIEEIQTQSTADRIAAAKEVPPITDKVTLSEAIARGLKYNLEHRVRLYEQALAFQQVDVARFDMLPKLVASAGYNERNNDLISRSMDSVTGEPSLAHPYISSDRGHNMSDLGLTWSLLDFGVSYYGAKQQADRLLIASERRRRAMHNLIQEIRSAFWRAASAQKLNDEVIRTVAVAEGALADSRKVEDEKVRSPVDALRFQRTLLENLRILEGIQNELSMARTELASLMNVPLGAEFVIAEPEGDSLTPANPNLSLERMEELAVVNNAELREQFYNVRIALDDTRRSLLRLFPNLSFNYSTRYDSNSYLINKNWNEAGLQLSFNLFNLLSAPSVLRSSEAAEAVAEQKRIAVQMAILTQVHLARQQLGNAFRQYGRADSIWQVDQRLQGHMSNREQVELQSKLEVVSNNASNIVSMLRRYQALAQVYAAAGKLQATLGLEPAIDSIHELSLPELTRAVEESMRRWDAGQPEPTQATSPQASSKLSPEATGTLAATPSPQEASEDNPLSGLFLALRQAFTAEE